MTARKFFLYLGALLWWTILLVWTAVSIAAVTYALTTGSRGSLVLFMIFASAGVGLTAFSAFVWWYVLKSNQH